MEPVTASRCAPVVKSWKNPEVIPVQCNIHPWMHGWFVVVKGPWDNGRERNYTIKTFRPEAIP